MGQTSSSSQQNVVEREAEALAASTGALPLLRKAFSLLSDPNSQTIPPFSLQKCFELKHHNLTSDQTDLPLLMTHLGASIVDLYFVADKGGLDWLQFLKGYTRCCGRSVASSSFNNLFRVFQLALDKAGLPAKFQFDEYDDNVKVKMSGSLLSTDVLMLIWTCWMLSWDTNKLKSSYRKGDIGLPDVSHLVLSAVESCAEGGEKLDPWDCSISSRDVNLPAAKIHSWALKTLPNLADCLSQFVRARLCYLQNEESCSSDSNTHSVTMSNMGLLTSGRAWALSLTLRGTMYEEISKLCFPIDLEISDEHLLYRSSVHGKGMNRFWSNVDGYNGPLLMLIAGYVENNLKRWVVGALTDQGFENKETFYGTSGVLYAISPTFNAFLSSGKEKNFVYSHVHTTIKRYEARPKPIGVAFGGSMGNERIYIDEDFAKVTLRHHAVDNTYQHGPLFPNQGYLPTEASVVEVEVWGLGGTRAHKFQSAHKKREDLFTEQRRKVDLNSFGNWEDSPEKMMMDIMSNPNAARREER